MKNIEKPLVWLHGEIKTPPPLSRAARVEAGYLLGLLQMGENFQCPHLNLCLRLDLDVMN